MLSKIVRILTIVAAAGLLSAGVRAGSQATPAAPSPGTPKLVVLLMVDQMRADYVDRFRKDWTDGLKRLVTSGAWFRHANYPYLNTVTCAGHATVSTGAYPHHTGMIGNAWYDRGRKMLVPCTADPMAHDIAYGGASMGADSPRTLMTPTLADELRMQRRAHVVSVSLKDRSAIMLAGHGGDAVTWRSNMLDGWLTSSAYTSALVPQVKAFLDAHPVESDLGKTWNRLLPSSRYEGPDDGLGEAPPTGWTRSFPHPLKGTNGTANNDFQLQWERSPFADAYLGQFAAALAESMQLGKHDGTDVLAISFSSPDLVGHAFGPQSQEVQDIYAQLDRTVGTLLRRLDTLVGRDAYVVGLSADHGVTSIPEQLKRQGRDAGRLNPITLAAIIDTRAKALAGDGHYVTQFAGNDIYFEPGMYDKLAAAPAAMAEVIHALEASAGVERVFRREELSAPGAATSDDVLLRAAALSYYPGRSGDLVLEPKAGWMFSPSGTTHGSANEDDEHVPVLLMGRGVKAGMYDQPATPADLAPTLAALAGVSMPSAEGRVLREAIAPGAVAAPSSK